MIRSVQPLEIIGRKRDGAEHSAEEIGRLISGYVAGEIADYQMAAWLMAVCTRGMTRAETLALTQAMVHSGEVLDLSSIPGIKVDKHSTGGVGDKVTLIAGPLAAACGVRVPKLSGRALAHTGGTLDKLESVPGMRVEMSPQAFTAQVSSLGLAVAAQSPRMVPADKLLYALRDVTATVPSLPLIASSVMSKKLAAGADAMVLDVKFGRGAFMATSGQAIDLATEMVGIGEGAGRSVVALVTAMDAPLGRSVGNALEVEEAFAALRGEADRDLLEVSIRVATEMCRLAGVQLDPRRAIEDGSALAKFEAMLRAQGGRPEEGLPVAAVRASLTATTEGYVEAVDALEIGLGCLQLGAGRQRKEDVIDPGAGLVIVAAVGAHVRPGDPLATVHAASVELIESAAGRLRSAWRISAREVEAPPHVLARVDRAGITDYRS